CSHTRVRAHTYLFVAFPLDIMYLVVQLLVIEVVTQLRRGHLHDGHHLDGDSAASEACVRLGVPSSSRRDDIRHTKARRQWRSRAGHLVKVPRLLRLRIEEVVAMLRLQYRVSLVQVAA